jgi:hypothetical protein
LIAQQLTGAGGRVEVSMPQDAQRPEAVPRNDVGAKQNQTIPQRVGRILAGAGALVLDADVTVVSIVDISQFDGAGRSHCVGARNHAGASAERGEAASAPLEDQAIAGYGEVLAAVALAAANVVLLDRLRQREGALLRGVVRQPGHVDIWICRVVDGDPDRFRVDYLIWWADLSAPVVATEDDRGVNAGIRAPHLLEFN